MIYAQEYFIIRYTTSLMGPLLLIMQDGGDCGPHTSEAFASHV
jgi:hypothetical protein